MVGSLLAFFYFCLVSVLFWGPSVTEIKFYWNFFPSSFCILSSLLCFCTFSSPSLYEMKLCRNIFPLVFVPFCGFLNQPLNRRQTCLLCWRWNFLRRRWTSFALETNTLVLETNELKMCARTSATQRASYQQRPNKRYVEMIASHSHSPPKTGGVTL